MNQDTPGRKALYAPPALGKTPVRMIYGKLRLVVLAGLLAVASLLGGCGKPSGPAGGTSTPSEIQNPKSEILKLHWLGKKQLAADTNATPVWDIWKLPESIRLETQTLDKLATAPWRLWAGAATPLSNAPTTLLRPLLDDLVQEETYLEIQSSPEGSPEIVLAVRLPADRAALWQANLPAILQSLSATVATNVTIARTNDWTIVSLASGLVPSTLVPRLFPQLLARLATNGTPHELRPTNHWIEITGNLRPLSQALKLGWETMTNLPAINLRISGDGQNVRTSGEFTFPSNLNLELAPWNIPTNLIQDPLIAFSAVRPLESIPKWFGRTNNEITKHLGAQGFSWANAGYPMQTFIAITSSSATNAISQISEAVAPAKRSGLLSAFPGTFNTATNLSGITADGVPFMAAFLKQTQLPEGEFLVGGFIPPQIRTNRPIPPELLTQLHTHPTLLYYDWEITGPRIESWTYIGQTLRLIFNLAQMPPKSAGFEWLKALLPRLGNSATAVTISSSNRVHFARSSMLGFTGLELHLLSDWLESPSFPMGLHSFEAPSQLPIPKLPPTPPKP
jgi:hypothetical protein